MNPTTVNPNEPDPARQHALFLTPLSTPQIYTLSLHDALPIFQERSAPAARLNLLLCKYADRSAYRSEEHTSELQSRPHLVCRPLLEKKNSRLPHRVPRSSP